MRRLMLAIALITAPIANAQKTVIVTTHDYAFQMPDTLPAGLTTFRIRNEGKEPHEMVVIKIGDHESLGAPLSPDHVFGGPAASLPGADSSSATIMLEAGHYEVVCGVPTVDHIEHMKKGMMKLLVVVPSTATVALPVSDLTISLVDYDYHLSHPLTAGRHTLRVVNTASQDHMMMLVKFKPHQNADSLGKWDVTRKGPAPIEWSTGVSSLRAGGTAYVNANFPPGHYALMCFLDAPDGKDHFEHGMHKDIIVQ